MKEARQRLNQTPQNSSRPPSTRAPWEREAVARPIDEPQESLAGEGEPVEKSAAEVKAHKGGAKEAKPRRKPGKPPGAPGVGRTQVLKAQEESAHYPERCAGCARGVSVEQRAAATAYTGFQMVDLRGGDAAEPGLRVWGVDHRYDEVACECGHRTRAVVGRGEVDAQLAGVQLSEWRRVGPGLATLRVALALRLRASRVLIREFLDDWLGLELSVGTLHQTVHEAGAALAPVEGEWVADVQNSELLYADETSVAPEGVRKLGLWVFTGCAVTLYCPGMGEPRLAWSVKK